MKSGIITGLFFSLFFSSYAQFPPPAGETGTTAIAKDSSVFAAWATGCSITRGLMDISTPDSGYASAGDSSLATGEGNGIVSLGDGGTAILTFANAIQNGQGWDFAVFENSFSNDFLELAFVEVSSDGINYFRFPATSYTQDTVQVSSFGLIDATRLNNLAGKYRALFGTPFDLEELATEVGLDVTNITHVKIIDAVGCIQDAYSTHDQYGNKINDPWSTLFPSSGFDLDAVGVIHQAPTGIDEASMVSQFNIYPNPVNENSVLQYRLLESSTVRIEIADVAGKIVFALPEQQQFQGLQQLRLNDLSLGNGIYFVTLFTESGTSVKKIITQQ